jgi:hypothetical protein
LDAIERAAVDQRLVRTRIPVSLVEHFANKGPIPQDRMQLAARKMKQGRRVEQAFLEELPLQRIERVTMIGIELVGTANIAGALLKDFD